jgi:hypothetical protein
MYIIADLIFAFGKSPFWYIKEGIGREKFGIYLVAIW